MPTGELIPLAQLLTALGAMLAIAVAVERFMLIFNWIIHRLLILQAPFESDPKEKYKNALDEAVRAKAEAEYLEKSTDDLTDQKSSIREIEPSPITSASDTDPVKKPYEMVPADSHFDIKPYELPSKRHIYKEFWIQLFASFVAITGCYLAKFSIWPFITLPQNGEQGLIWLDLNAAESQPWEYILTGIIIGAGTKPVYFLMNFLINRKVVLTRQETKQEEISIPHPEPEVPEETLPKKTGKVPEPMTIEEIIGFSYNGGNRPERIEHSHRRKQPVDLIVYHHTAMHSDAPFEEVVKEFDRKGWMTGYHCVVTKNGDINILTRWDRIGSHAKGNNFRSLGIALHGNFETTPGVPGANPDGRLGMLFPTPAQIDAAAKVIVIWALLYQVRIDFQKSIVPHKALQPTACPGNNFPYDNFQKLIKEYASRWRQNQQITKALEQFKSTPLVFAEVPNNE